MFDLYGIPAALITEFEALLRTLALPSAVIVRTPSRLPGCTRYHIGPLTPAQETAFRTACAWPA